MTVQETAISLPFKVNPGGVVTVTTDQSKIWADRVLSVIGTGLLERTSNPLFGSKVFQKLFDTVGIATSTIKDDIFDAFASYLPLLTLMSVDTEYDEQSNTLTVSVTYSLPNDQVATATVGTAHINGNNPLTEDI